MFFSSFHQRKVLLRRAARGFPNMTWGGERRERREIAKSEEGEERVAMALSNCAGFRAHGNHMELFSQEAIRA